MTGIMTCIDHDTKGRQNVWVFFHFSKAGINIQSSHKMYTCACIHVTIKHPNKIHKVQLKHAVKSSWVRLVPACWCRTASQTQTSAVLPWASQRRPLLCSGLLPLSDPGLSLNCARIERASSLFACEGREERNCSLTVNKPQQSGSEDLH